MRSFDSGGSHDRSHVVSQFIKRRGGIVTVRHVRPALVETTIRAKDAHDSHMVRMVGCSHPTSMFCAAGGIATMAGPAP